MGKESFNHHILVENISKQFPSNDYKTVDNISFSVTKGEAFSLLGPSGCGKTTLMRIIAGFETPDAGRILINGQDMTDIPPNKRPINMMFQSYALFPHMSVEENIMFGLQQENLSKQEMKSRFEEAIDMVGLEEFIKRKPDQLSGGQRQRTALARSIIKRPELLLLDEPLGALDRKTRENTLMELIKIQDQLKMTFIVVTHDQEEALAVSDCIAVMNKGEFHQIGSPEQIYEYPSSRFVADFIGSINMLHGFITKVSGNKVEISCADCRGKIIADKSETLSKNMEVWLALRPEEMVISDKEDKKNPNQIIGNIVDIGYLGDKIIYHIALDTEKIISASLPTSAFSKNPNLSVGKKAYLSWHQEDGVVLTK